VIDFPWLFQLPLYAVFALGCYGVAMVGYGMMVFPTCPHEADLLAKVKLLSILFADSRNLKSK
jgi:dolichyl-phosphate mannosyltransferase polypeptide 3